MNILLSQDQLEITLLYICKVVSKWSGLSTRSSDLELTLTINELYIIVELAGSQVKWSLVDLADSQAKPFLVDLVDSEDQLLV